MTKPPHSQGFCHCNQKTTTYKLTSTTTSKTMNRKFGCSGTKLSISSTKLISPLFFLRFIAQVVLVDVGDVRRRDGKRNGQRSSECPMLYVGCLKSNCLTDDPLWDINSRSVPCRAVSSRPVPCGLQCVFGARFVRRRIRKTVAKCCRAM